MATGIEWTNETWNPTSGCDKVSPGCDNCYALGMAKRLKAMGQAGYQNDGDPRTSGPGFRLTLHPDRLDLPLRWKKPRKIFVNSMSDLFHKDVPDDFIAKVWQAMGMAPHHAYQILTKRHARMQSWVSRWYAGEIAEPYDVRPAPGYPGYMVTTTGGVLGKRMDTRAGLAQDLGDQGHRRVTMHRTGSPPSGSRELVHRLVLTTFVRPPQPGEQACHRNGNPADNRLSNLYWGTQEANWQDRIRHGNFRSYSKLSEDDVSAIRGRCAEGESACRVAQDYPVSDTQIKNIVRGKQWVTEAAKSTVSAGGRSVLDCVWLGVSVEDQKWADIRIPALLDTPAAVRWISAEPLLGPIDLHGQVDPNGGRPKMLYALPPGRPYFPAADPESLLSGPISVKPTLDWVVAGGESGPGARPMHRDWAMQLRDQCSAASVPFLFKQAGAVLARQWGGKGKGGDPSGWPESFPREYPNA